nr:hypothetical protein [Evansella caseinilytica]
MCGKLISAVDGNNTYPDGIIYFFDGMPVQNDGKKLYLGGMK